MRPLQAGSQCEQILAWLARGHTLTTMQAFSKWGITTLSQRCGELRRRGHAVESRMVLVGRARVARYRLET